MTSLLFDAIINTEIKRNETARRDSRFPKFQKENSKKGLTNSEEYGTINPEDKKGSDNMTGAELILKMIRDYEKAPRKEAQKAEKKYEEVKKNS